MEWLEVIKNVVGIIGTLAVTAEAVLGPKKGPEKKAIVEAGVKGAVAQIANVSTGGQKETWEKIGAADELISGLIDTTVAEANLMEEFKSGK